MSEWRRVQRLCGGGHLKRRRQRRADEISRDRCPTTHKIGRLFAFHVPRQYALQFGSACGRMVAGIIQTDLSRICIKKTGREGGRTGHCPQVLLISPVDRMLLSFHARVELSWSGLHPSCSNPSLLFLVHCKKVCKFQMELPPRLGRAR